MSLPRRVALLSLLLVVPLLPAAPASAAPRIQQRSLAPTSALPDTPVAATLSVGSLSTCVTVDELGVGVRDANQQNLDFPGSTGRTRICPGGYTLTTAARGFPAGTYTEFGFYRIGSTYYDLPSQTLTVAAPTVRQLALVPARAVADTPVTATLALNSTACLTADEVGVGVRDANQQNLDFPGTATDVRICPQGYTLTTAARSFPAGTYTEFGFYRIGGEYHDLPGRTFTVTGSVVPPHPPTPPFPAGQLVFDEEFSSPPALGTVWNSSTTSAYRYGNHNPDDDKLDWLQPGALSSRSGANTFTATPGTNLLENGDRSWDTGLLTTEGTQQGFQVRPGDYAEVRIQLPGGNGAWPALWTWKDGGNEIDSFEYHPDNPNLLELSNRINSAGTYYTDADAIRPGAWVSIGVHYGASNNDWYVNHELVFSDHTGTGPNWSAYLIFNLSICAGSWHPAPSDTDPISTAADYLRVWRPRA
ncbi:hypothetical protein K353_00617 [Kitasatospora sp. SolWspMP-SS2h]|uniref:glycoside hydrolase family 16 protein n=1 Tax=Kitasatospora sp. SolWspMP-SS2h TaxID=1305729 RepID=UPI000DBA1B99|nr:hypothetical protein [Kitasatospora sp. SolWspMP-SS2h]RAJ46240.1 hypothetical protein K353_00617 [Kitasatospora sp. SolWspMP-SS2h]